MHVPDRSTVVTDDGAQLAVYTNGNDVASTTAILAHGYMMSADVWRMQVRDLTARGFRVIRYDQRFHGNSTGGTERARVGVVPDGPGPRRWTSRGAGADRVPAPGAHRPRHPAP
ncbi:MULTISPECIES: alpha/beta fold hydrolase [unclassified Streptomyces]|uniref:alpha/beta fold hydrolase n=1 Tax=unclassified Streptomyces TaxID=2593676 RepID=UPI003D8A7273